MSAGQLLLIVLVALVVFGPTKLPTLATHLGQLLKKVNEYKQQARLIWQQYVNEQQLKENIQKAKDADIS